MVRRWIARELSPISRVKQFAGDAETAIRNLARMTEPKPQPVVEPPRGGGAFLWFALGAAVAGAAFLAGLLLR